jgi:hypothetical protein
MIQQYLLLFDLQPDFQLSDLKQAFRVLSKRYHPDLNISPDAHEKFIEITQGFEILKQHLTHKNSPYSSGYQEPNHQTKYEYIKQQVRKKAQEQARKKYADFKQQHEAFQERGINDLALLFKISIRIIILPVVLFLVFIPIYLAITELAGLISLSLLLWPMAGGFIWYIKDNRKNYFKPGEFYYSLNDLVKLYTETKETDTDCFYCKGKKANSKPFIINLLKLKDIKLNSGGFRQHQINYKNENVKVKVPRSQKALIIHTISIVIKVLSIVICIAFSLVDSVLWRLILGFFIGEMISGIVLLTTRTKSHISYLLSIIMVIKITSWLVFLSLATDFDYSHLNIKTNDNIYLIIFSILIFDCFIEQFLKSVLGQKIVKPLFSQTNEINNLFSNRYELYNDIPIWTVVFPVIKLIFG